jgi:multisubunit Na+/H+ antiporter MnhG subunit
VSGIYPDAVIWFLLLTSVFFGGIGIIGLLLFPDTRSRQYTAFRATIICVFALVLAVIIFGLTAFLNLGGDQYSTLILHTIFLFVIIVIGNIVVSRMICGPPFGEHTCEISPPGSAPPGTEK